MAPRPPTLADLENAYPVYCLDLHYAGTVFRVATHPIDIHTAGGRVLHYTDGLSDPDFPDEVAREGIQDSNAIPLACYLDGVSVPELVARGYRLEAARGHLFMVLMDRDTLRSGQTQAQVFPLLTGRVSRPQDADPERAQSFLSFSLEDSAGDDRSLLHDSRHVIDEQTFSGAPSTSIGKLYPLIYGTPGVFRKADGTASTTSGSPAYVVALTGSDADTILIAGHEVAAATVTVFDEDRNAYTATVSTALDGRGNAVATADISGASSPFSRQQTEYYVCWNGGGGMRSPFKAAAMAGLGEVCVSALLQTSLPVDLEKWVVEGGLLDRIEVSTYSNSATISPWSFVTRLLSDLPIEVRSGPLGLYPHVRHFDAAMAEGLTLIIEGTDFEPTGPRTVQTRIAEVINQVTIRFAPRAKTGDFKRSVTITPDPDSSDNESFPDEYAVISANRWSTDAAEPVVQSETIELPHIYDDTTAALIATERIRDKGFGYASRPYIADVRHGWLSPGDQFRLESESLHRTYLATLLSKRWTGTAWAMVVALDDDPVRDSAMKKTGT